MMQMEEQVISEQFIQHDDAIMEDEEALFFSTQCLALQEPLTFDDAAIFFSKEEWKEWKELEEWFIGDGHKEFPSYCALLARDEQRNGNNDAYETEPDNKEETNEFLSTEDRPSIPNSFCQEESLGNPQEQSEQLFEACSESSSGNRTVNDKIAEQGHHPTNLIGQISESNATYGAMNDNAEHQTEQSAPLSGNDSVISSNESAVNDPTEEQNDLSAALSGTNKENRPNCSAAEGSTNGPTSGPVDIITKDHRHKSTIPEGSHSEEIVSYEEVKNNTTLVENGQLTPPAQGSAMEISSNNHVTNSIQEQKDQSTLLPVEGSENVLHFIAENKAFGVQNIQLISHTGVGSEVSNHRIVNDWVRDHSDQSTQLPVESSETFPCFIAQNTTSAEQNVQSVTHDLSNRKTVNDLIQDQKDQSICLLLKSFEKLPHFMAKNTSFGEKNMQLIPYAGEGSEVSNHFRIVNDLIQDQKDQPILLPVESSVECARCMAENTSTDKKNVQGVPLSEESSKVSNHYRLVNYLNPDQKDQSTPLGANSLEKCPSYETENKPIEEPNFHSIPGVEVSNHYRTMNDSSHDQKDQSSHSTGKESVNSYPYRAVTVTRGEDKDQSLLPIRRCSENSSIHNSANETANRRNSQSTTSTGKTPQMSAHYRLLNAAGGEQKGQLISSAQKISEKDTHFKIAIETTRDQEDQSPPSLSNCLEEKLQFSAGSNASGKQEHQLAPTAGKSLEMRSSCGAVHDTCVTQKGRSPPAAEKSHMVSPQNSTANEIAKEQKLAPTAVQNVEKISCYRAVTDTTREQKYQPTPPHGKSSETISSCSADGAGKEKGLLALTAGNSSQVLTHSSTVIDPNGKEKARCSPSAVQTSEKSTFYSAVNATATAEKKQPPGNISDPSSLYSTAEDKTRKEKRTAMKSTEWDSVITALKESFKKVKKTPAGKSSKKSACNKDAKPDNGIQKDQPTPLVRKQSEKTSCYSAANGRTENLKKPSPLTAGESSEAKFYSSAAKKPNVKQKGKTSPPADKTLEQSSVYSAVNATPKRDKKKPARKGSACIDVNTITRDDKKCPAGKRSEKTARIKNANAGLDNQKDQPKHHARKTAKKRSHSSAGNDTTRQQKCLPTTTGKIVEVSPQFKSVNSTTRDKKETEARKKYEKQTKQKTQKEIDAEHQQQPTDNNVKCKSSSEKRKQSTPHGKGIIKKSAGNKKVRRVQPVHYPWTNSENANGAVNGSDTPHKNQLGHPFHKSLGNNVNNRNAKKTTGEQKDQSEKSDDCAADTTANDVVSNPADLSKSNQYLCTKCGESFSWKSILVKHHRTHRVTTQLTCDECGKVFKRKALLLQHKEVHARQNLLTCKECGQRFRVMANLIKHQMVHPGYKHFKCTECGQTFSQMDHLNHHKMAHAKEKGEPKPEDHKHQGKALTDDQAGKTFTQKSDLTRHQLARNGKGPFTCDTCGEKFVEMYRLMQHKLSRHGKKSFKSWLCTLVQL